MEKYMENRRENGKNLKKKIILKKCLIKYMNKIIIINILIYYYFNKGQNIY